MIAMTIGHAPLAILGMIYFAFRWESLPFLIASAVLHVGYQVFLMNAVSLWRIIKYLSDYRRIIAADFTDHHVLYWSGYLNQWTDDRHFDHFPVDDIWDLRNSGINNDGPKGLLLPALPASLLPVIPWWMH